MGLSADICGRAKSEERRFIPGHQSGPGSLVLEEMVLIHFKGTRRGGGGGGGVVMGPHPMIEIPKAELLYGPLNLECQALPQMPCL